MNIDPDVIQRAQGALLGQLAGDSLGSLVEFESPEQILSKYPGGVRELADGGTWGTIAGQPTDDSEMALMLARMLVEKGNYDAVEAKQAYRFWINSRPFDVGNTTRQGLTGIPNPGSEANGALMRISPLGIFGALLPPEAVAEMARRDAAITHPNPICQQVNALYAMAIAQAVRQQSDAQALYEQIVAWASAMQVDGKIMAAIRNAAQVPPAEYVYQQGWVLIAFQNALWQMLHAESLEEAVVDTVMRGGDTDTNAAICGALVGALYGRAAIPEQWLNALLACRPVAGAAHVRHPRPECFWPVDALELAEGLVQVGARGGL